jgi:hypothetical protein
MTGSLNPPIKRLVSACLEQPYLWLGLVADRMVWVTMPRIVGGGVDARAVTDGRVAA